MRVCGSVWITSELLKGYHPRGPRADCFGRGNEHLVFTLHLADA
jgi:hypothetical protein